MKDYTKLTSLIVEDDPTNQLIAETLLKKIGVQCDVANNGEEAIQILKEKDYDFTLMDINMPGPDGLDTGKWIRAYSDLNDRSMPIFAVTSFDSEKHTEEIKNAGINEHLTKPFSLDQILPLLDKYFWQKIGK
jgi:CheY-like chemotaxis protein